MKFNICGFDMQKLLQILHDFSMKSYGWIFIRVNLLKQPIYRIKIPFNFDFQFIFFLYQKKNHIFLFNIVIKTKHLYQKNYVETQSLSIMIEIFFFWYKGDVWNLLGFEMTDLPIGHHNVGPVTILTSSSLCFFLLHSHSILQNP